jgi:tRNA(Ile)-lysidine synthase
MLAALEAVGLAHGRLQVAVGFSGGLDSTVLLHVACTVADELEAPEPLAVHIHHGLQDAAESWAHHCQRVASALGAGFMLERVTLEREGGDSLEAVAREARMQVFNTIDADAVLLGHHRDDQVETVLFNALRGTGLAGLSGIPSVRALPGGRPLLRPFLGLPRSQLREYAMRNALTWVEDPSNDFGGIRRNHLRNTVLPLVEAQMPQARPALARLAEHAAEAQRIADDLADLDTAANTDDRGLRCRALAELPPHRARNLLRRQLAQAGLRMPDAARLDEMLRQLGGDGRPELLHDGHVVTRRQGRLVIRPV